MFWWQSHQCLSRMLTQYIFYCCTFCQMLRDSWLDVINNVTILSPKISVKCLQHYLSLNVSVEQKRRMSQIEIMKMALKKVDSDSEDERVRFICYQTNNLLTQFVFNPFLLTKIWSRRLWKHLAKNMKNLAIMIL